MPLLTVVLPTYNGQKHIEETIRSILDQTFGDFELLVLDDCSSDDTLKCVSSFIDPRIRVHRNVVNLGLASNMNIGMALAQGKFLARVDQDDVARSDRFAQQVEFLLRRTDITVVSSQVEHFGQLEFMGDSLPLDDQTIKARFVSGTHYFANQASMGRLSFYRTHRLQFDPSLYVVDDLGFWFDCMLAGAKFANLAEPLTRYRVHEGMTSMNLNIERLNKSKDRLYRRLLPTYFPQINGEECERLLAVYHMGRPVGWEVEELTHLHKIVGGAVYCVDDRWGQSADECRRLLLGFLDHFRSESIAAKTITAEQNLMLEKVFYEARDSV